MNIKVILNDVNDYDSTVTLSESRDGNVIITIEHWSGGTYERIVKPDELLRAARLFVTTNTGDTDS